MTKYYVAIFSVCMNMKTYLQLFAHVPESIEVGGHVILSGQVDFIISYQLPDVITARRQYVY